MSAKTRNERKTSNKNIVLTEEEQDTPYLIKESGKNTRKYN
jgi:hypothetical protein